MNDTQCDFRGIPIKPLCHVSIRTEGFANQEGVVVGFDKSMIPAGGPIIVYLRKAPDSLFIHDGKCFVKEEHRIGMPAIEDADFNPLAIAFEGSDLSVIGGLAPMDLIGQIQQRKCQLTLADQEHLGITRDRATRRRHSDANQHPELAIPGLQYQP